MQWEPISASWPTWTLFMSRLSSPMEVTRPPFRVPVWIEQCSRITFPAPISSSLVSPLKLLSWGSSPTTAKEKMRVPGPTVVRPVT